MQSHPTDRRPFKRPSLQGARRPGQSGRAKQLGPLVTGTWILTGLAGFLHTSLFLPTSLGGEVPLANRAAAWESAKDQKRLVMVIDTTGDFAQRPYDSRSYRLIRSLLRDGRLAQYLNRHFVVAVQQVGNRQFVRQASNKRSNAKADVRREPRAITYFCRPDRRVLHFVVGIPSAAHLLNEARWAHRVHEHSRQEFQPTESVVRRDHQKRMEPAVANALTQRQRGSLWLGATRRRPPTDVDRRHVLDSARATRIAMLRSRFGATASSEVLERLFFHPDVGLGVGNLVMTELPLVPLPKVQSLVFESLVGLPFTSADQDCRQQLVEISERLKQKLPVLVQVQRGFSNVEPKVPGKKITPYFDRPGLKKVVTRFERITATTGQLAYVLAELRIPPLTIQQGRQLRAIAVNPRRRVAVLHSGLSAASAGGQLSRLLHSR